MRTGQGKDKGSSTEATSGLLGEGGSFGHSGFPSGVGSIEARDAESPSFLERCRPRVRPRPAPVAYPPPAGRMSGAGYSTQPTPFPHRALRATAGSLHPIGCGVRYEVPAGGCLSRHRIPVRATDGRTTGARRPSVPFPTPARCGLRRSAGVRGPERDSGRGCGAEAASGSRWSSSTTPCMPSRAIPSPPRPWRASNPRDRVGDSTGVPQAICHRC